MIRRIITWLTKWAASNRYPLMRTPEERMWHAGHAAGVNDGRAWGWREGYDEGVKDGCDRGYKAGFEECGRLLEGKS